MNADERAILRYTRRLESLANRVTVSRLFSGDGLNHFLDVQKDVFQLQIDLQRDIGEVKQGRRKSAAKASHLSSLRNRKWHAKRLGDAIAWSGLLFNRQLIKALNQNTPVPTPSAWTDGHRGAFEFARATTSREWGIPVIHDITNVLRVGDVTFMLPSESRHPRDAIYRTVELKTTRVGESVDEDGQTTIQLTVTVIGNEPLPFAVRPAPEDREVSAPAQQRRPDRRIERQLARMDIATASKNAPMHELTKIGDDYNFNLQLAEEQQPHWKELRRAIRTARREGFAYFELGGFVGYSLIYNATGVTEDDIKASPLPDHVVGLMHKETAERNSITISTFPDDDEDEYSADVLPLFLWEIPHRAIRDILRNRLMITATYNAGWMEKLLSDAGLTVNPDTSGRDPRNFEVVAHFEWEGEAQVEYHSHVWREMWVAVHEFRGPTAVVQRAVAPMSAPSLASLENFIPPRDSDGDHSNASDTKALDQTSG